MHRPLPIPLRLRLLEDGFKPRAQDFYWFIESPLATERSPSFFCPIYLEQLWNDCESHLWDAAPHLLLQVSW